MFFKFLGYAEGFDMVMQSILRNDYLATIKGKLTPYGLRKILTKETQRMCQAVEISGQQVISFARYTYKPAEGFKNRITDNTREQDFPNREPAKRQDYVEQELFKRIAEDTIDQYEVEKLRAELQRQVDNQQVFALFEDEYNMYKNSAGGVFRHYAQDDSLCFYQSRDKKIQFMEIQSRKNADQYLLFLVLGDTGAGGSEKSILVLRSTKPFDIEHNPDLIKNIEYERRIAVQAYKNRMETGSMEFEIPVYDIPGVADGIAFLLYESARNYREQIPDHVLQDVTKYMISAVESSYARECNTHLAEIAKFVDFSIDECKKELMDTLYNDDIVLSVTGKYTNSKLKDIEDKGVKNEINIRQAMLMILSGICKHILTDIAAGEQTPMDILDKYSAEHTHRREDLKKTLSDESLDVNARNNAEKRYNLYGTVLSFLGSIRARFIGKDDAEVPPGVVVIGNMITERSVSELKHVAGIISQGATTTSHPAILARQNNLIFGAMMNNEDLDGIDFMDLVDSGDRILLAPSEGKIIIKASAADKDHLLNQSQIIEAIQEKLRAACDYESSRPLLVNGREIVLQVNAAMNGLPQEGFSRQVGLFRMESEIIARKGLLPNQQDWEKILKTLLTVYPDKITLRTVDEGRDKKYDQLEYPLPEHPEDQPLREYILTNPQIREAHLDYLAAIFHVAELITNHNENYPAQALLEIMYPMVETLDDLIFYQKFFDIMQMQYPKAQLKQGAMIETLGAINNVEEILDRVDFASIGSNDMTMGVMQMKNRPDPIRDGLQPQVLGAIRKVIGVANAKGKPVKVCGEMAGIPLISCILLSFGQTDLSMDNKSVPQVYATIRYAIEHNLFPQITALTDKFLTDFNTGERVKKKDIKIFYNSIRELFKGNSDLYEMLRI